MGLFTCLVFTSCPEDVNLLKFRLQNLREKSLNVVLYCRALLVSRTQLFSCTVGINLFTHILSILTLLSLFTWMVTRAVSPRANPTFFRRTETATGPLRLVHRP